MFPIPEIIQCSTSVLQKHGQQALQYSTTEGIPQLRSWIADRMNKQLLTSFTADDILITHGSQQALDLSGKVFLDEGDVVLEDNPYGELRYESEQLPSIKHFDTDGHVLCCGTFSKIFYPGYRIGWIAGRADIIRQFVTVKQGSDLQCNTLAQMEILEYMQTYDIDAHIAKITTLYHHRRDLSLQTLDASFPSSVTYTRPLGGLFCWVSLPKHLDAQTILTTCLQHKVAFVPGASFFATQSQKNHFRINFSNLSEDRIITGIQILGKVLYEEIAKAAIE